MEHGKRKHALLSPSGAHRWLNCTPSAVLSEQFENKTSIYAIEGTLAHEFADVTLRHFNGEITKRKLNSEIKKIKNNELYAEEMDGFVQKYVDYVIECFAELKQLTPDAVLLIEQKVSFIAFVPDGRGSCDAVIIADGWMYVIDLKYGKGVEVSAENNPQLRLYALGALLEYSLLYDIQKIKMIIVQPRLDHISEDVIEASELMNWATKEVKPKAAQAFKGEGLQCAGSWCKWCPTKPKCATLASYNTKLAQHEFKNPHLLTDTQVIEVFKQQPILIDWAASVAKYILDEALKGKEWPGYKVVEGVSRRKWKDELKVIEKLIEEDQDFEKITETKLLGITKIEKLLGKELFKDYLSELIERPPGKPILVESSDKRPPYNKAEQAKEIFK